MTTFVSLFKQKQTLIFDLGNIVNDIYTAPFNVTLTAAFFIADDSIEPADVVLPISARKGAAGKASVFSLPPDNATNEIVFPRNVRRAVVTLSATGQIDEEVCSCSASRLRLTATVLVEQCSFLCRRYVSERWHSSGLLTFPRSATLHRQCSCWGRVAIPNHIHWRRGTWTVAANRWY